MARHNFSVSSRHSETDWAANNLRKAKEKRGFFSYVQEVSTEKEEDKKKKQEKIEDIKFSEKKMEVHKEETESQEAESKIISTELNFVFGAISIELRPSEKTADVGSLCRMDSDLERPNPRSYHNQPRTKRIYREKTEISEPKYRR